MMSIDELHERLKDDTSTFSAPEVRHLLEDTERRALTDVYNNARIAAATRHAQEQRDIARSCADQLLGAWNNVMSPTLEVVHYG